MKQTNKKFLEVKSTASYLYQRFLRIDKRIRKNMLVGGGMILAVVFTGLIVATVALFEMGGRLIAQADLKNVENKMISTQKIN